MSKPSSLPERPSEMFRFVRLAAVTAAATLALTACATSTGAPSADQRTITRAPSPSVTAPVVPTTVPTSPAQPPPPASGSGVQGTTVTKRCPVETEPPCPATAVITHVVVSDANGTVATADTGVDGRFRIALKPGHYTVTATPTGTAIVRPASTTVTVTAGQWAPLTLTMDSGIR
jgi:hypothetical protein